MRAKERLVGAHIREVAEPEREFLDDFAVVGEKESDAHTPMHFNDRSRVGQRTTRKHRTETARAPRINPVAL